MAGAAGDAFTILTVASLTVWGENAAGLFLV
jgi:hypothetical protein